MLSIKKAAVIGAGTMGAQIAAHLANVGIPSLLLDIPSSDSKDRNQTTQTLWDRARALSPSPLYLPESAKLVRIGNIEDDLPAIRDADWILEAVVERFDVKQQLLPKIATHARPDALITTNTSGIGIGRLAAMLPAECRTRFFGSHFFNPPRAMRLLELISTNETDPLVLKEFSDFAEAVLGKGIAIAKDSPGFISNRIGFFAIMHAVHLALKEGFTVDETDAITGPALGRPRSATFRLCDVIGLDVMEHIGANLLENLPQDDGRPFFEQPKCMKEIRERGWLGEKKGQGFYKRTRVEGKSEILSLDCTTLEHRPRAKFEFESLTKIAKVKDTAERIRTLCAGNDRAAQFAWKHLSAVLCYSADHLNEVAHDVVSVDRVQRWGFNWELGPFQIWDALGVKETTARLEKEGRRVPEIVQKLLKTGSSFYREEAVPSYFHISGDYRALESSPKAIHLSKCREIQRNEGASLLDLGDGIACLEFHSKLNTLGPDQLGLLRDAKQQKFKGLVIGNQGSHYSAGANLGLFLKQAQEKKWGEMDAFLKLFQEATGSRTCAFPVVAACHHYTLGGGCETALGASWVVAAAETFMGLPEAKVGVIPAAGGTKEVLLRHLCHMESPDVLFDRVHRAWKLIFSAHVSTNGPEARKLGYLHPDLSHIVLNDDWLIGEAKAKTLELAGSYKPTPLIQDLPALGSAGIAKFDEMLEAMRKSDAITDHDVTIGKKLAYVLCGGEKAGTMSEQKVLDLEREAFLSLCGDPKTVARIQHMLDTGKPLRN